VVQVARHERTLPAREVNHWTLETRDVVREPVTIGAVNVLGNRIL
jgi:hypothetical protein